MTSVSHGAQRLRLSDGRTVICTSPAEARMLWGEMSTQGFYRRAAARLHPGEIAVDVGANIGLSAIMFADVRPEVRVIAAEPAPASFACLERNMAAYVPNGLPLRVAVGATTGVQSFTWYPQAPANSGLYANQEADDESTKVFLRNSGLSDETIELLTEGLHVGELMDVHVTTVSAILDEHGRSREVGLLKVDVERAELDVLRGVAEKDWRRIRAVVAEVHDEDDRLAKFCALLGGQGMSTQTRQDPSLRGTGLHEVYASRTEPI